jgi:outer membrane protein TolC
MNLNYYNNKLIKDSNELIKLSKRSYEAGKSNLTALIVMEQQYREIVSGYVNALSDYYIDWVEFLREINKEDFDIDEKTL